MYIYIYLSFPARQFDASLWDHCDALRVTGEVSFLSLRPRLSPLALGLSSTLAAPLYTFLPFLKATPLDVLVAPCPSAAAQLVEPLAALRSTSVWAGSLSFLSSAALANSFSSMSFTRSANSAILRSHPRSCPRSSYARIFSRSVTTS